MFFLHPEKIGLRNFPAKKRRKMVLCSGGSRPPDKGGGGGGGGGDGHPDAEKRGEGPVSKIIFFGPLSLSLD